jgi:hypothetical protein
VKLLDTKFCENPRSCFRYSDRAILVGWRRSCESAKNGQSYVRCVRAVACIDIPTAFVLLRAEVVPSVCCVPVYSAPWLRTHTSPRCSLLAKCQTVSWCTRKCNFIYTHNNNAALPGPIFTKLAIGQRRYMEISVPHFTHVAQEIGEPPVEMCLLPWG